jgi:hypothetical protein
MTHYYLLVIGIKIPDGPCPILVRTWKPKLEIEEPSGAYSMLYIYMGNGSTATTVMSWKFYEA